MARRCAHGAPLAVVAFCIRSADSAPWTHSAFGLALHAQFQPPWVLYGRRQFFSSPASVSVLRSSPITSSASSGRRLRLALVAGSVVAITDETHASEASRL